MYDHLMMGYDPTVIVQEVIEAHGGLKLWNNLESIEAVISASGFLFTAKRRPLLDHIRIRVLTGKPHFMFFDFPKAGQIGELIGNEEVRITDVKGNIMERRSSPRSAFRGLRRQFTWDDLDFIYFGGYATWNYLVIPFIFLREGFRFEIIEPTEVDDADTIQLRVTFPDDIPTHCKTQTYYFDGQRLLRRLDYTAEVVGRWARAAHLCEEYRDFEGLQVPTRRRVLPIIRKTKPLPVPTLVALRIHDIHLVRSS